MTTRTKSRSKARWLAAIGLAIGLVLGAGLPASAADMPSAIEIDHFDRLGGGGCPYGKKTDYLEITNTGTETVDLNIYFFVGPEMTIAENTVRESYDWRHLTWSYSYAATRGQLWGADFLHYQDTLAAGETHRYTPSVAPAVACEPHHSTPLYTAFVFDANMTQQLGHTRVDAVFVD